MGKTIAISTSDCPARPRQRLVFINSLPGAGPSAAHAPSADNANGKGAALQIETRLLTGPVTTYARGRRGRMKEKTSGRLRTNVPYCGFYGQPLTFPLRPVRKPVREGNDSSRSPTREPQGPHSWIVRSEGPARKGWGVGCRKATGSVGGEGSARKGWAGQRDEGSLGNTGEL